MTERARALCLLAGLAALACGSARSPGADVTVADASSSSSAAATASDTTVSRFHIRPDFLPPPGRCRIWEPGEPPEEQKDRHPIGRCSRLRESIPEGAWLVYRPTDDTRHVRVWLYGDERQVLQQRIYDIETGALVRHVAPASGN